MNPRSLPAILALAFLLAACGGGGSPAPPPSGPYSNASLHGQYAFALTGLDLNGAYISRVGSFTADGAGNITAGVEDLQALSTGEGAVTSPITGGSYQIQSTGRGTLTLTAANGDSVQARLVMQSTSTGFLIQTDLNAACSGSFNLQTASDFNGAALAHPYVFKTAGVSFSSTNAAPLALVGQLTADGSSTITGGVMDTNDGNSSTPSGATPIPPGTYALDTTGNGTSFGRGTISFNGRTFAFYIVDSTRFKLLEEDTLGGSTGEALLQSPTVPLQNADLTGSFVYLIDGLSVLGSQGPLTRVARFTADGNGGVGNISLDDNANGWYRHTSQGGNISDATYTVDAANAGSGRATFTFTDSGKGTSSGVIYMNSLTQGVVQDTSSGIIGNGQFVAQAGGPFTVAGSAGTYISNWSGVQLGSSTAIAFVETFVNQFVLSGSSSNNVGGTTDYIELGLSSKTLYSDVGLSGSLKIAKDSTLNNEFKFAVNGSPSVTVTFQAYFVNPNTLFMICSDSTRTTAAAIFLQQQ